MQMAICDDCCGDAKHLKDLLEGYEVTVYSDAASLLLDVEVKKTFYQIYFLDIYIENSMNGIELAKRIQMTDKEAVICFVSTSNAFYREAYDLYAIQYLLKPVQKEQLDLLCEKVSGRLKNKEQSLSFKSRGQTGTIPYSKILFISSREHMVYIYCTDQTVQECKGKLNELAIKMCGNVFLRCHQSYLVNMYHVDRLRGNEMMVSGHCIPISRRYYAQVRQRYQEILFEEVD